MYPKNIILILEKLFLNLNIPYNKRSLEKALETHPNYPSMACMSDILDEWSVPNLALRLQPLQLKEISYPAVAHCTTQGGIGYFVLLENLKDEDITFYDTQQGKTVMSIEDFKKQWAGTTLLVNKDELSGELNYKETSKKENHRKWEQRLAVSFLGMIAFLGVAMAAKDWQSLLYLTTSIAGIVVSLAILLKDYGQKDNFILKLCNIHKQTDCDQVTHSKGSKLFNWLSWSEIGLFYFAGGAIALLMSVLSGEQKFVISLLATINIMALPYTLFSIYYQAKVVKKWCPLCLVILGILWLQFAILIPFYTGPYINIYATPMLIGGFLIIPTAWFLLKPLLEKNRLSKGHERELARLKRNVNVFKAYLHAGPKYRFETWQDELIFGNPEAPVTLMVVSNPFCGPCELSHKQIERLLYTQDIKVILRFTGDTHNLSSDKNSMIRHLIRLRGMDNFNAALNAWYEMRDYTKWVKQYPAEPYAREEEVLHQHLSWAENVGISYTPTIYINGYELTSPYNYNHLIYYIKHLEQKKQILEVES